MVDAVVSFAVEGWGDFLIQQLSLRKSIRNEVTWLRNELNHMQAFLRDAEQKQCDGDERVQQWVMEINSIANDAVAVLETYSFEASKGDDDGFASRLKVQKLGDFLTQEVSLLTSLRNEVTWLRDELGYMQAFLRDAEQKQSGDQRVQHWVFDINSIANDAVAILETYSVEAGKSFNRLKACACICRKDKKFYNVAKKIQPLKQPIIDISSKRETYGITNNAGEGPSNQSAMVTTLRRTTSYVDEDHIFVGFQDVVKTLLAELLKPKPHRSILSIHGMCWGFN